MNTDAEHPQSSDSSDSGLSVQQRLALLNQFRLLENAVQSTQLRVAGQVVVPVQEIVGVVISAKAEFEAGHLDLSIQALRQSAEAYRYKSVRWEAALRAAQGGQRQLSITQKKQLPAESSAVRTTSRKTLIFFERLTSTLIDMAQKEAAKKQPPVEPAEEPSEPQPEEVVDEAMEEVGPAEVWPPIGEGMRDGFTFIRDTETDEDGGITLNFSLTSTKQFAIDAVDLADAGELVVRFQHSSPNAAMLQIQLYNQAIEPLLRRPRTLDLTVLSDNTVEARIADVARIVAAEIEDRRAIAVEIINVAEDVELGDIKLSVGSSSK